MATLTTGANPEWCALDFCVEAATESQRHRELIKLCVSVTL